MFDEGNITDRGKEMNDIKIAGQNDEHEMKLKMITTISHRFQSSLEYHYDKRQII